MINPKNKLIIKHLVIIGCAAAYAFIIKTCIFRTVFGNPCPFCGLTRAYTALMQLDFIAAFNYHPLFLFIPILLLFAFHYRKLRIKEKTANIIIIIGAIIILIVYIIRMINGSI